MSLIEHTLIKLCFILLIETVLITLMMSIPGLTTLWLMLWFICFSLFWYVVWNASR